MYYVNFLMGLWNGYKGTWFDRKILMVLVCFKHQHTNLFNDLMNDCNYHEQRNLENSILKLRIKRKDFTCDFFSKNTRWNHAELWFLSISNIFWWSFNWTFLTSTFLITIQTTSLIIKSWKLKKNTLKRSNHGWMNKIPFLRNSIHFHVIHVTRFWWIFIWRTWPAN